MTKSDFLTHQLKFDRVHSAIDAKQAEIEKLLKLNDIELGNFHLLMIAFKESDELELYAKPKEAEQFRKIQSYPICRRSGLPGPKRKEGDEQVPEGFYYIDRFNPKSKFHLSLGLNFPNESDQKKGDTSNLGGDIFIHGSCQTTGCIPVTDSKIEEIYLYAIHARDNGQEKIPVYIFPFKMTDANMERYRVKYRLEPELIAFWENLKVGYDQFCIEKKVLNISFSGNGDYKY